IMKGSVRLTLERTADGRPAGLKALPARPGAERDRALRDNHAAANDFVLVRGTAEAHDGRFSATLQLPRALPWPAVVLRVTATGRRGEEARGARRLLVSRSGSEP